MKEIQSREKIQARLIRVGSGTGERRETFQGGRLELRSTKGIRGPDRVALEALPVQMEGQILVVGSREAISGMAVKTLHPDCDVHVFHLDAYEHACAAASCKRNELPAVHCRIGPDLPRSGTFDWVVLCAPQAGNSALIGELVRQSLDALKPKGKILAVTDQKRGRWLHERVLEVFGAATIVEGKFSGSVYIARRKPGHDPKDRDDRRTFEARLFGQTLTLESRPGVFSHGELDEGTLALSEVAELVPGARVLDMGCGSGALGVGAARARGDSIAALVDSNARAVQAGFRNARTNGVADRVIVALSYDFACLRDASFDLVLANPPYFGDWRIAERFVREGHRALRPGGSFYLVSKSVDEPTDILRQAFGGSMRTERRGYSVLRSVKGLRP